MASTFREASNTPIICGIDVSSTKLDARIGRDGPHLQVPSTEEGADALQAFCQQHGATLCVMEATGGYERPAFARLWARGMPTAIANPRSVRKFAEGVGVLEKTDRIDAGVIAWHAETKRMKPTQPASADQQRLTALVTHLRQLTEQKVVLQNQARLVDDADVLASFGLVLGTVRAQIKAVASKVAALIDADPLWAKLDAAFRTIKGVADRTVARLMAELPELGTISGKAITKLTGLAPLANQSGNHDGPRRTRGGREGPRSILFIAAGLAARHEPDFHDFDERLTKQGKPRMVVRIALAHKLLTRLNAKAREVRAEMAEAARKLEQTNPEHNDAAQAAHPGPLPKEEGAAGAVVPRQEGRYPFSARKNWSASSS